MKRILIISVLLFTFSASWAQTTLSDKVVVTNATPMQNGNSLLIDMVIDASKLSLPSHQEVILTPVLKSVEGTKNFDPIIIQGRNKYLSEKRSNKLNGRKAHENAVAVVRSNDKQIAYLTYRVTVPYEAWMESAVLDIKIDRVGCVNCKKGDEIVNRVSDSIITQANLVDKPSDIIFVSYVAPKAEAVKNRDRSGTAFLDFKVGKSDISADFKNNLNELTKIQEAVSLISKNTNATINSIDMVGYASPDGSYKINDRLSASRALALKNYLQSKYGYAPNLFNVTSVAEDWEGLRFHIAQSNLDMKADVLNIIDDHMLSPDAKEAKLKRLPRGAYKTLLDNFFPLLRRVEYTVKYTIRAFSVDEGKQVIKTNPGEMSLNEMFLVANTFPKNSNDFKEIFDVAVKMYPEDLTANLNAGANALERNDKVGAHAYLDKLIEFPAAWNNIGVLAYKEGRFDQAKTLFLKAQQEGSTDAVKNLEMMKQKDDYEAMLQHTKTVISKRAKLK